ncbi:hypothetical protein GCM10011579_086860 [Streptomyces albiflavescens]|uniref:Exo-alpha-sialidase n=1 Tax=Streptomyces albiflavescens TaxID=1623582 RepID=A0A917YE13_9ACTN|nr:hypothetical protein GCM10011579_086860 [Streptomyces albiflavescens]
MDEVEGDEGGAYITLRVSRDSGRTWGPRTTYQPGREALPIESGGRFPPCECPRCAHLK